MDSSDFGKTITIPLDRWKRVLAIAQIAVKLDAAKAQEIVEIEETLARNGQIPRGADSGIALWSAIIGMGGIHPGDLDPL